MNGMLPGLTEKIMNAISIPQTLLAKEYIAYSDEGDARKKSMHRDGKKLLQKIASAIGLAKGEYDIRSNMGSIAVSGEVTMHGEKVYVQMYESCVGNGGLDLLYRACNGRKDYSGGRNNTISLRTLTDPDRMERFIAALKNMAQA